MAIRTDNPHTAPLAHFHSAVRDWFERNFNAPTECQAEAWPAIAAGRNTLIAAPTGSGKTLAAFLGAIDELVRLGLNNRLDDSTRVLYVSPLKALSNDIQRNLERPLMGISDCLNEQGLPAVGIRTLVRTGDTTQAARSAMRKVPPHILVTTPESLYILLTSASGRRMLATVRHVIVDEIHALAGSKRGAHLALSLERLQALAEHPINRIGLSATQKPIETIAHFLMGGGRGAGRGARSHIPTLPRLETSPKSNKCWNVRPGTNQLQTHKPDCLIIDSGHVRRRDLAIEVPDTPLQGILSADSWEEIHTRLCTLIEQHHTTLIFVNTRRLAERLAHALSQRLGEEHVTSHHGSLAKEQRLDAEQRLKHGQLQALVATASLELGIDIGDVDLVCQISSPRSIATFLQRVGRSGHAVTGTPKGRLFPLSRDDLVECCALLDAVRREELDYLNLPEAPLDVLAQQIVAMAACEDWDEDALLELVRRAWNYRGLSQDAFRGCLRMLAEGFATRRGRRSAYLHRDTVNHRLRGRKGARLTALTNGGAIPDNADFDVILEPEALFIGTLNEDFAIESMPGDIFLLGNSSWRILKVESGKVRVADAQGQPPNIPFWFGEAPGRTDELSHSVARLNREVVRLLHGPEGATDHALRQQAVAQFRTRLDLGTSAAEQLIDYLAAGLAALGALPDYDTVILERFFDDSGGMQLVIHSGFGSRVNRAWGLALRKRFCRSFNFELQAAANEDAIILSLGETHSFPLEEVSRFLSAASVREVLIQALLDAPVFTIRWRWNANISLAVPRFRGGAKVPPQIQRMQAEDLVAVTFPDQIACVENLSGPRSIPDHPLVRQTLDDALTEAMDIGGLESLLKRREAGELTLIARDLTEPSPLSAEILTANPYAFLDDAPAEERRTRAVSSRRHLDPESAADISRVDAGALQRVREEAWPQCADAEELHDALVLMGVMNEDEIQQRLPAAAPGWLDALYCQRRAARVRIPGQPQSLRVAAERWQEFSTLHPEAIANPTLSTPEEYLRPDLDRQRALLELLRARLQVCGPVTAGELAQTLRVEIQAIDIALGQLEAQGFVIQGHFEAPVQALQWCERRLLARSHRYTLKRRRQEIEPVSRALFMQFLFVWQHLSPAQRLHGPQGLQQILERLEGAEVNASSWEAGVLPDRLDEFDPNWLDQLCLAGQFTWCRLPPRGSRATPEATAGALRSLGNTPIALLSRGNRSLWAGIGAAANGIAHGPSRRVLDCLEQRGALFFDELCANTGLERAQVERALGELAALGLVSSDGFAGLRALIRRRRENQHLRLDSAGRWSRSGGLEPLSDPQQQRLRELDNAERLARILLNRYGVLCKRLLDRESMPSAWRDVLQVLRRLEARGEIRGGRFVAGLAGEQYALPEALKALGECRRRTPRGELISIRATDPFNLTSIITPGPRIASRPGHRIVYRDGVPVAVRKGRTLQHLVELAADDAWRVRQLLFKDGRIPVYVNARDAPAAAPV